LLKNFPAKLLKNLY